jgi:cation diffusion facilitator CzcD-associated flavoprotein CzcO
MVVRLILDVVVIGGGQAGIAMGYHLQRAGRDFAIVDAASEIRESWRSRGDSLVLFTSAQFDNLPGLPFPAEHDTYPSKDDPRARGRRDYVLLNARSRLSRRVLSCGGPQS